MVKCYVFVVITIVDSPEVFTSYIDGCVWVCVSVCCSLKY